MALSPVAGSKIYIGTPLDTKSTDFVAADFTALTYTEITEWTQRGDYGDTAALITDQIIGEGRDQKSKGTRNAGSMENEFALKTGVASSAGMQALVAAAATNNAYAFKVENNDKPVAGASPKNSADYFLALVMSTRVRGGTANTNRKVAATLEIVSNIVSVPASAT